MTNQDYGERVDPATAAPRLYAEHVARYRFAAALMRGRRVLDAAAGTGYGAAILLESGARSVVAVDASSDALARCSELAPGALLLRADVTRLSLRDGSIEACVSFETLEHVAAVREYVGELARVLVDDGVLVLSTPNRVSRLVSHANPFHIREFTRAELAELLAPLFQIESWAGQDVEGGGARGVLRRWIAVSPLVAVVRGLLPTRLRRIAGAAVTGGGTAEIVPLGPSTATGTFVVHARRRARPAQDECSPLPPIEGVRE